MTVGGVCSLAAGVIVSFIPITRLIHTMANDNILKISLANKIFGKGGSPRIAVIFSSFIQLPLLFINYTYIETVFYLMIFCGILNNIISSITYYYLIFNDKKNVTGTEIIQSHELTYRKFSEKSDSENKYNSDEETSTDDDELDYVFKGQYKTRDFRYGTISKSHNCIFQECQTSGKHVLEHIYETPLQTEVYLTNSKNDDKIFNCISKKHLTNETANLWLVLYIFCTILLTIIITQNNYQTLKKQSIPILVILLIIITFCLFGIIYVFISIFFSDVNDNLNDIINNKRNIKKKEIFQRLLNIFLLQLGIAYFNLNNFLIIFIWLLIGFLYYLTIIKKKL
uniref:Amino acid permease/ SLC12A domain-containing protein n=1 Tax=Strongyloides stercoralis TaxID=6248 RepID=A0A0K0EC12_STRER